MAARLFVALLGVVALPGGWAPAAAQRLELRAGGVVSSALAHDAIAAGASAVTVRARPAPWLGAAGLFPLRPGVDLEVAGGWAFSELQVVDGAGTRDVQGLGIGQASVGLRWVAADRPYVRVAVGAIRYGSPARGIFAGGAPVQPLAEAGVGWERTTGRWRIGAEGALQWHRFETSVLQAAGASPGGVRCALLLLTLSPGGLR